MEFHVTNDLKRDPSRNTLTVAEAVEYWLENRQSEVKRSTWDSYRCVAVYVIGPLLHGSKVERYHYTRRARLPEGASLVQMLGHSLVAELTTAGIRAWHKTVASEVSSYTANAAKKVLRASLALVAEDFGISIPVMPSRTGRGRPRPKKAILTPDQVGLLLNAAQEDKRKGVYYAFPFLTGVRPSEQFALLWSDVDLDAGLIHIRRMQERDGSLCEITKTIASVRDIPISPLLRTLLVNWRTRCPTSGDLHGRVFPGLGRSYSSRRRAGRPLSYTNFIYSYWRPGLIALGLPIVTPHSARHSFISILQSEGVEVGLVAKLAGHANVSVTLGHYTQAVRGGQVAVSALERAYGHGSVDQNHSNSAAGMPIAAS
jgi:integrase